MNRREFMEAGAALPVSDLGSPVVPEKAAPWVNSTPLERKPLVRRTLRVRRGRAWGPDRDIVGS